MKLVIADNVSIYVDAAYANIESLLGVKILIPVALFSFQILADFGGYSFIAIGVAMLFGVKLMENFKSPYFAKTLSEFWTRWHISLSTWFKDYLYIPLGGNKKGSSRTIVNLAIVFIVSGIWHGSSWNFLIWGGIHAAAICLERLLVIKNRQENSSWKGKMAKIGRTLIVFSIVTFNSVFFRSPDLSSSFLVFKQISTNFFGSVLDLGWIIKSTFLDDNYGLHSIARWIAKDFPVGTFVNIEFIFFTFYCTIPVIVVFDFYTRNSGIVKILKNETFLKRLFCSFLVVFIFLFGQFFTNDNFIYFQF